MSLIHALNVRIEFQPFHSRVKLASFIPSRFVVLLPPTKPRISSHPFGLLAFCTLVNRHCCDVHYIPCNLYDPNSKPHRANVHFAPSQP